MTGFEFFFSFYGLILGLAMAELLSGFASVVRAGRLRRIGWGTALLAIELSYEMIIFGLAAWHNYQKVEPKLVTLAVPFLSGAAYFVAAVLVFPRDLERWPRLDDYFMAHKRQVATCLLFIFLLGIVNESPYFFRAVGLRQWAYLFGYYIPFNATVLAGYLVLMFSRSRRWSLAALVGMIGWYLLVTGTGY